MHPVLMLLVDPA